MKFGFIAHPTSLDLKHQVGILDLMGRQAAQQESGAYKPELWRKENLVPFMDFGVIRGAEGHHCSGLLHYLPMTAAEMLHQPRQVSARVIEAVRSLHAKGADLVGLGGFTAIVGRRGEQTWQETGVPVTTGNSLTAFAAYRNLLDAMESLGVDPPGTRVALVGFPGSIVLAVARLLLNHDCQLVLVHRSGRDRQQSLDLLPDADPAQIECTNSVDTTYENTRFFLGASSSGYLIDSAHLLPGSVVVDAALPRDVIPPDQARSDILLIDGGLVSGDERVTLGSQWAGLSPRCQINGCLAETLILALENRAENFSLGRDLPSDKVLEIGRLAHQHGFSSLPMSSGGIALTRPDFERLSHYHRMPQTRRALTGIDAEPAALRPAVLDRFARHINPLLADFYRQHHIERVFSRGEGAWLTDLDGTRYLDFVAGYGCLNTGHNHPQIKAALQQHLEVSAPTFVQYVSSPLQTSLLAERLSELAPGDLSRVFFSNSGTEAVEAALKLAMAAQPDRTRLVYCDNGYHGKTLGALSVTGREKHRRWFEPLRADTTAIPFGDPEALDRALRSRDVVAFVVEPIQGEGGVILPPADYLQQVRTLCDRYETLMVLDEVQTGLGRTGHWFACNREAVEPDVLVLSKSLSGGVVPIGATLCSPELWDRAWGDVDRFAAHTSTFGGGNLAASAALATLDVIASEGLVDRARTLGDTLRGNLEEVASQYPFIRAVRGQGLMMAVEFCPDYSGGLRALAHEMASRLPGAWFSTYRFLPGDARHAIERASDLIEQSFGDLFVQTLVSKMANEHQILTFVTANNNRVLRIQPPLIITEREAQHFVTAFEQCCRDLSTVMD